MADGKREERNGVGLFLLLAFLLVCAVLFLVSHFGHTGLIFGQDAYHSLNGGWRVSGEDTPWEKVDLPYKLDVSAGETYYSSYTFTQDDAGSMMRIRSSMQDVSVYLDGTLIFQGLKPEGSFLAVPNASLWYFVDLPEDLAGKTITMEWTAHEEAFAGSLNEVAIGSGDALLYQLLESHASSAFISILLLFFGICSIFIALLIKGNRKNPFVFLGLFAVCMSAWIFSEAKLMQLITGNWFIVGAISYMALPLMPGFFLMFLRCYVLKKFQKHVTIVSGVFFTLFFVNLVLQLLGIASFFATIKISNGLMGAVVLLVVGLLWLEGYKYRNASAKKMLSYFSIFAFVSVLEIVEFLMGDYDHLSMYSSIGVVWFFALIARDSLVNFNEMMGRDREREFLKKLAFIDVLTGGKNRAAFERDRELILEKNPNQSFRLVFLDVNHLKMINDTFGHTEGDKLIRTCFSILEETFGYCGDIYRMGGDEFACVMFDTDIRTYEKHLSELKEKSKVLQDWEPFPVEIAIGSDVFHTDRDECFQAFYHRVDQLMYKNKKKLKESFEL